MRVKSDCLNISCTTNGCSCDINIQLKDVETVAYSANQAHHQVKVTAEHHLSDKIIHGGSMTIQIPAQCGLEPSSTKFENGNCKLHFDRNQ